MIPMNEEIQNRCQAVIRFGDDYGDNCSTFHCQREAGHEGKHREVGDMGYGVSPIPYTLEWDGDSGPEDSEEELPPSMPEGGTDVMK